MSNIELFLYHFDRIHQKISPNFTNGNYEYSAFMNDLNRAKEKDRCIRNNFKTLEKFATFRNLEAHSNNLAPHFAEPHQDIVKRIENIANAIDPAAKAIDRSVKADQIYTAKLHENAKQVIQKMTKHNFNHTPVYDDDNNLVGVFSESSIFDYFGSNDEIILDASTTIAEFKENM